ncbi:MAG: hypothetical protein KDJ47_15345 [Hyphomicrobiaceae bacterium]|nr:hypothetical protein [Hyphomicrobiaceae bacterium]
MTETDAHPSPDCSERIRSIGPPKPQLHPASRQLETVLDAILARGAEIHHPDAWPVLMDQEAASAFLLHVCGVRLAPKSLQKRRVVGGSPPFRKLGVRVAYPRDLLKAWGDALAGPVVNSTSELSAP